MTVFDFSEQSFPPSVLPPDNNLNGSNFFKATLEGTSLAGRLLRGTNFEEASLIGVNATGANPAFLTN